MDPYGPPRKRPRPESGPLNGSNGANSGHGGGDDCKSFVFPFHPCSGHWGAHALRMSSAKTFSPPLCAPSRKTNKTYHAHVNHLRNTNNIIVLDNVDNKDGSSGNRTKPCTKFFR